MKPIFVDASAIVAMMTNEPEAARLIETLLARNRRSTSPVAVWEASVAVARIRKRTISEAARAVETFCVDFDVSVIVIGAEEGVLALAAHRRYGKGSKHAARLNMGDCFAYACAKANGAELLYKGDDFVHTDLA